MYMNRREPKNESSKEPDKTRTSLNHGGNSAWA